MTTTPVTGTPTVAILGLGAMGLPMARHLSATFPVRTYDVDPARSALGAEFGHAATTAGDAATGADVVLVAVRSQDQLVELLWGEDGIAAAMALGATVLLTSTVGIDGARTVAARLADQGIRFVDAPVSGGPVRAGTGDLLVTVGANDESWHAALPVLEAMAATLVRVGMRPGDGQSMKTVNQLLAGVHIAATAEALALAAALGLDPGVALTTLMSGAAASFILGDRGPRALQAYEDGGAEVRSRLDIFVKDMAIVAEAARAAHVAIPVASAAQSLYVIGDTLGMGADDDSSVIRLVSPAPIHLSPES